MPKTPIKQEPSKEIIIQEIPTKVAVDISFVERIDINRTSIWGCPKYPNPQARADIIASADTPFPIERALGFTSRTICIACPKPPK